MKLHRPLKHSILMGLVILISLLILSAFVLAWSYNSAIDSFDKELAASFEARHTILESLIEGRMTQLDLALNDMLDHPRLMAEIVNNRADRAGDLMLRAMDIPAGILLDMVFISTPQTPVWAAAGLAWDDARAVLPDIAGTDIPSRGGILRIKSPQADITLALKEIPVVYPPTGHRLGRLIGGFILNGNRDLLEQIRDKTRSRHIQFFVNGDTVASSQVPADPVVTTLHGIRRIIQPQEVHYSNGLIAVFDRLRLWGAETDLEVMTAIPDKAYRDLKRSYRTKISIVFSLSVGICLGLVWLIRRLTEPSFQTLLQFCADVTLGNTEAAFAPGNITELNKVGESVESMVKNLADANDELRFLRNYLSDIIDSMPSVLVGIGKDGLISQWNQGAWQATGLPPKHALGRHLNSVFPRLAKEMDRVNQAIQTRRTLVAAKKPFQAGGMTRYEDITIYPLTADGVEGAVLRVDDVTDQVRMEEMVVQSEKMMSVGGLAAGMAHEINNPLAGMIQSAEVIKRRLSTHIPANERAARALGLDMADIRTFMEQRSIFKLLDAIRSSGHVAAEIVSNMLSFARKGDAGKSCNCLAGLMDEALALAGSDYDLKKRYDFRQINITKNYDPDMPLVPCESGKIRQVLLNILSNGAHAMFSRAQAEPESYIPQFTIGIRKDARTAMALVEIRDNGPGMDETVRKRIFEPFFTTKPEGQGTGLGLSVSYFIIKENHNGSLSVTSAPGHGTTFSIRLPLKQVTSLECGERGELQW